MEQQPLPPAPSIGKTVSDVFAAPSEIFQSLKGTASAPTLWVVPMIINMVMAVIVVFSIFTDEALRSQVKDQQYTAIEKQVEEGKMTRENADTAHDQMDKAGSGIFIAFGAIGAVFMVAIMFFLGALFLWSADKSILKSTESYEKHLELYGIASWIGVLGTIITLFMMVGLGSIYAQPSGALAVMSEFNPTDYLHKLLNSIGIFPIWQATVLGIGLSKFSGKSSGTGMGVAFGLWILWVLLQVFAGFGM